MTHSYSSIVLFLNKSEMDKVSLDPTYIIIIIS